MMTDDQARALGLRAVASPRWRWMPGMLVVDPLGAPHRISSVDRSVGCTDVTLDCGAYWLTAHQLARWWPDLRDAATVGCVLALAREVALVESHAYPQTAPEALVGVLESAA